MEKNPVDISDNINLNHEDFFANKDRILLFYGGAGAAKSYSTADKILMRCGAEDNLKILVVRKTLPSLRRTCLTLIEERAEKLGIPYHLNKSDFVANCNIDSKIYYLSMNQKDDYEKIKSITDVDMIWIEEANELAEYAFDLLNLRLRGGKGEYKQIILSFNPIGTTSWIYDKFFLRNEECAKIHTTVYDNPWADKEYIKILENLKNTNINLHNVYCRGDWGRLEGVIYNNWDIAEKVPEKVDEVIYGLDFGYNNPSALIKVSISDNEFWLEQLIYETHLTNNDLINKMKALNINRNDSIYCDSAEPARIEEIRKAGFNSRSSDKEVLAGIDFCQAQKLHVLDSSDNLIKELNSYVWEMDKDNKPLDRPVKFNDHALDSFRMCCFTHYGRRVEVRARFI